MEGDHTYFVGKNCGGLWVHNIRCPGQLKLFDDVTNYEWHHVFPMYLGGPEKQPLVHLPDWYHDSIHYELDKVYPRWRGAAHYVGTPTSEILDALKSVYIRHSLYIDPLTGSPFRWKH